MRAIILSVSLAVAAVALPAGAQAVSQRYELNIPRQSLDAALKDLANQTGLQIARFVEIVDAGLMGGPVSGRVSAEDALKTLLAPHGLTYKVVNERTIAVVERGSAEKARKSVSAESNSPSSDPFRLAQADEQAESKPETAEDPENQNQTQEVSQEISEDTLAEVLVTGTHIRGIAPDSAPLTIYDREYIEKSGVATVDQFLRQLPQNFSSTDPASFGHSLGGSSGGLQQAGTAYVGQAGINLHGLGPSSTLVLLNGRRLAPGGQKGSFVDVSAIPLSAVERVEVLTDGASALYGADAIAGVVNFVLRKDFKGAETTLRQSGATRGGAEESSAAQLFGTSWATGNGLIVYDYNRQQGLYSRERDFVPEALVSISLLPESVSHSAHATVSQDAFWGISTSVDAFYSDRKSSNVGSSGNATSTHFHILTSEAQHLGGALGLSRQIAGDWRLDLTGNYGKIEQEQRTEFFNTPSSLPVTASESELAQVELKADGSLISINDRTVKIALGAGTRREEGSTPFSQFVQRGTLKRRVNSAYGELLIPLVLREDLIPLVDRLELSAAVRHDRYDDTGSSTNPKFGLLWAPVSGLSLRGTYATSYRAPLLEELMFVPNYLVQNLADVSAPDGATLTLVNGSTGGSLKPEESETVTAGVDFHPEHMPALSIAITYFRTDFTNRLAAAPILGGRRNLYAPSNVEILSSLIDRSPDTEEMQAIFDSGWVLNPASAPNGALSIEATYDARLLNLSASRESGVDVAASYLFRTSRGEIATNVSGTFMHEIGHRTLSTTPWVDFVNTVSQPLKRRLRGSIGWSTGGLTSSLSVNYAGGYVNNLITPATKISSWTTADAFLSYKWSSSGSLRFLSGAKLSLSIQNMTDEDPPFVRSPFTMLGIDGNYDASNASPLGRVVALGITKPW